ncbi:hypothetical protein CVT24_010905 [Panaeolus cyanescens]|uniref:Uncharacterized protein n=1 Tax=Panaeolus cyanescens TaxID=181874 RepID=A0A409X111_9AGAR|nr:hypothetical protein CVT24_010905 [Panaeolus cyanescens]
MCYRAVLSGDKNSSAPCAYCSVYKKACKLSDRDPDTEEIDWAVPVKGIKLVLPTRKGNAQETTRTQRDDMEVSGPCPANQNASSQSNKALETAVTTAPLKADSETKTAPPKESSDVMKADDASGRPPPKNKATARKAITSSNKDDKGKNRDEGHGDNETKDASTKGSSNMIEADDGNRRPSPRKKVTATTATTSANKGDKGTTKTEISSTWPNPTARHDQDSLIPQHSAKLTETPATTPGKPLEGSDHSKTQVQEIKNIGQALTALTDAVVRQTQVQQQQLDVLNKMCDALGSTAESTRSMMRCIETMTLLKSGLQGIGLKSFYDDREFASAVMGLASEIRLQRGRSVNDNGEGDTDDHLSDEESEVQVLVGTRHLRGKAKSTIGDEKPDNVGESDVDS